MVQQWGLYIIYNGSDFINLLKPLTGKGFRGF
nr:MAG TPA: hypothetical protein [Caudoviricetes sp.]